ncbi:hypothetical protein KY290_010650 [Solanum tuberosum]|uniref:Uncharacterized protein n=1 Tax=Solanum tuberosum TaxID=4113 RepID=A0ABQ7VYE1_SOLTU|nr:hypothetical protein KY290_010650 [Solanum tuberosum]
MISIICRNARSIDTQGALNRLQRLEDYHNLSMIVVLEPVSNKSKLNSYRVQLRMGNAIHNSNTKIWLFLNKDIECNILDQDEQQITCEVKHVSYHVTYITTFLYSKCKNHMRTDLWDKMLLFLGLDKPWCSIGDFNVITDIEET